MRAALAALAVLVSPGACASEHSLGHDDDADVAGEYTLALTTGRNGCAIDGFQEGGTATGIPLAVTQSGREVTATVGGGAAIGLALLYGSATYTGAVEGRRLQMTILGKTARRSGNCVYTMKTDVHAVARGDFLSGIVKHLPAHNGNSDCAAVACSTDQSFNGSRPPRP